MAQPFTMGRVKFNPSSPPDYVFEEMLAGVWTASHGGTEGACLTAASAAGYIPYQVDTILGTFTTWVRRNET